MKKMSKKIEIPEGIETELNENLLKVKGKEGEIEKEFYHPYVNLNKNKEIILESKNDRKKTLAVVKTWSIIIKNMFKGVKEGYEYKMKIVHVHFPMTVKVEGNKFIINNFLGQKQPRTTKILDGVEIKVEDDEVTLKGVDKEKLGQTAGNIEQITKLKTRRDRRVFSDGIYLVSKGD